MIIFLGDKPSKSNTDLDVAFKGAKCEKRLKEWLKVVAHDRFYFLINSTDADAIGLINLCYATQGCVIALGNNASKFLKTAPHFKMPHPSGRNRQLNSPQYVSKKLKECREYLLKY